MEGLSGPSALLSNLVHTVPLVLEISGLGLSLIDFIRDSVKGHDPLHKQSRDSDSEEADEHIVISNVSVGDIALEG